MFDIAANTMLKSTVASPKCPSSNVLVALLAQQWPTVYRSVAISTVPTFRPWRLKAAGPKLGDSKEGSTTAATRPIESVAWFGRLGSIGCTQEDRVSGWRTTTIIVIRKAASFALSS